MSCFSKTQNENAQWAIEENEKTGNLGYFPHGQVFSEGVIKTS